ncbi:tetratricopeptide repeat protein [Nocardia sp. NPDC052001]|uniref:tetratricopeptide repeat protein n=1 Tax=Nocardia sp. NPDC052001 TaxID=3154853 RepID=UPI00342FB7B3
MGDLETMTTVVAILRPPAAVLPAVGADLAFAHRYLAWILYDADRYDEALVEVEEALSVCRRAPLVRRVTTEVQFIAALNVRALVLLEMGRAAEAVDDARNALILSRGRLPYAPHRYRPGLLYALDVMARSLNRTDEPGQALPHGQELVDILRRLTPRRPRYKSLLAASLVQLGIYLAHLGDLTAALRATEESLGLFRQLTEDEPERHAGGVEHATENRDLLLTMLENED